MFVNFLSELPENRAFVMFVFFHTKKKQRTNYVRFSVVDRLIRTFGRRRPSFCTTCNRPIDRNRFEYFRRECYSEVHVCRAVVL